MKIFRVVTERTYESKNKISCYHFIFKEGSTPDEGIQRALFHQTLLATEQHAIPV